MKTLSLTIFLAAGFLSAAPVADKDLRKAVETWVRHSTADRRLDAAIERVEPYLEDGVVAAYIVHLAQGGYCLAGADSLVLPVYWYSPTGQFDPNHPGLRVILAEIAGRQKHLKREVAQNGAAAKRDAQDLSKRKVLWADLSAGRTAQPALQAAATTRVLPLTCQWDQDSPYNDQCPGAQGLHTAVGCVATAMAQVMYYWRWPNTGVGSSGLVAYDYRWTTANLTTPLANNPGIPAGWKGGRLNWNAGTLQMSGTWDASVLRAAVALSNDPAYQNALGTLWNRLTPGRTVRSADFGATTYNWDLLQDVHSDNPVDDGDREVAKLSYHLGLAVNMNYGLFESLALADPIAPALAGYFRYDPDVGGTGRDINLMVEEIRWQRPFLLRGQSTSDGHLWVVDGYNQGTSPWEFRMNMGWGGTSNGWYSVDDVPHGFNNQQGNIIYIAPLHRVRFVGSTGPGDGSPHEPHRNIEEALAFATDGTTLMFKADSVNTFAAPRLVINRRLTLKGYNITIKK